MTLEGTQLIGHRRRADGERTFRGYNPAAGEELEPTYTDATEEELDEALDLAEEAFEAYREVDPDQKAAFLRRIADEILELGDELIERAAAETGLTKGRLMGERGRTVGQLRLFADVVEEGSWVDARIDTEPGVRRMLIPIGPVVVFGASNFPLAFSVAGGDTASALAAGCPVVFKAHPAHPGTSELVGRAVVDAAEATGMPEGVFSLVHGTSHEVGLYLVRHPLTRAVGFTGSLKGGRAIFDAATSRDEPIPVYAEMGSINPVFVLPSALEADSDSIAEGLVESITLGVGQFCTNPGLIIGLGGDHLEGFAQKVAVNTEDTSAGTMLYPGIRESFEAGIQKFQGIGGVEVLARAKDRPEPEKTEAAASVLLTDDEIVLSNHDLQDEVFGPSSLVVRCSSPARMEAVARSLDGQLTASIHGTEDDLREHQALVDILQRKVGRLIFNDFPTGVAVCHAMHHGGPYPATTDVRTTSVGTAAIERFARPICYQAFPDETLPEALRDRNPRGIWRLVDGRFTRDPIA